MQHTFFFFPVLIFPPITCTVLTTSLVGFPPYLGREWKANIFFRNSFGNLADLQLQSWSQRHVDRAHNLYDAPFSVDHVRVPEVRLE
jgi:hypothetical protein